MTPGPNRQELTDRTVLIWGGFGGDRPAGAGCLIDEEHVLTCRHVIGNPAFVKESFSSQTVIVSSVDNRQRTSADLVSVGEGLASGLVLLRLKSPPLRPALQPARFASYFQYLGKNFGTYVADYASQNYTISTGFFEANEDSEGRIRIQSSLNDPGGLLSGAPVWSEAAEAFVGIVAFTPLERSDSWCIASRVLCSLYPDLLVQFRILPDRPPVKDPTIDDPNSEIFGKTSENGQRRLTATVDIQANGYASLRLRYEALPNSPKPRGRFVTFVTYPDMMEYETIKEIDSNGRADVQYDQLIVPDFTVAAIGDGGDTRLALDLTIVPGTKPTPQASGPPSAFVSGPPGFSREFCAIGQKREVEDQLDVDDFAKRLAELIALRETRLPLAIGLFGNWGSGKSHFMNLMGQHIGKLAGESKADWEQRAKEYQGALRPDPNDQGPWCREIVSVHFNAWHYVDTNLWASLVSQIFESLFVHLSPRQDQLEKVQDLLKEASGATARAGEDLALAKNETIKATEELKAAQEARVSHQSVVNGMLFGLNRLLPGSLEEVQKSVTTLLDDQKDVKTLNELRDAVVTAKTFSGRARTLWNSFWKAPGRNFRLGWLFVVVAATVLVPRLFIQMGWQVEGREILTRLVTTLVTLTPLVARVVNRSKQSLDAVEKWANQAEAAQQEAMTTPAVKQAEQNVTAATARETAARLRLAEAEDRKKQLEAEERSLSPERRISRFIEQRAHSSDYQGQLGLVSLARRDFEELSNLFADQEALNARLEKVKQEKGAGEADTIQALSQSVDRIVLFVDDLDRCQPDKVVDILQAVHLLLAFPLFAVVVGVDQRCLRQSLQTQFKGLLTAADANTSNDEYPATPLDYLEKIFHVPFHLPQMQKKGFGKLIESLTEPPPGLSESGTEKIPPLSQEAQPTEPILPPIPDLIAKSQGFEPGGGGENVISAPESSGKTEAQPTAASVKVEVPVQAVPPDNAPRIIGSVPLNRWERDALKDYYMLIHTPRAAKRLLNTYWLVRAGILGTEWNAFCGDQKKNGEFRLVMLLLAAAAGSPAVARVWFIALRMNNTSHTGQPAGNWPVFKYLFDYLPLKPSQDRLNIWLARVEQFAF